MKKYLIISILGAFWACKEPQNTLPDTPKEAAIYYWKLANEGMKGDTAKYRSYRQGFLRDTLTNQDIFGGLLIYETAKTTHRGTVKIFQDLKEKVIKRDSFAQFYEIEETILFTFDDGTIDSVTTRLILENKVWKMKWQNEENYFAK